MLQYSGSCGVMSFAFYQDNDSKDWIKLNWLRFVCPKVTKNPSRPPDLNVTKQM